MEFRNLTPHTLNIYRALVNTDGAETGETILTLSLSPSGVLPRVSERTIYCFTHLSTGIDTYRTEYGMVENLPDKEDDVFLIVSAMVRLALPERSDLCSPGKLLRDDKGNPIGCVGVYINKQR